MNFFSFDSQTRSVVVAPSFWHYWAITIPVTIGVVLLWNFWVWCEKRYSIAPGDDELRYPLGGTLINEIGTGNIGRGGQSLNQGPGNRY